jgi:hypothetical protein
MMRFNPGTTANRSQGRSKRLLRAFTYPEMQISLTIFIIVIGAMSVTYLFGIRLFELIRPKLDATDQARKFLGTLSYEIKSAAVVKIGAGNRNSFAEVGANTNQVGNAIQIYPDSNTNIFIRYYLDTTAKTVNRWVNSNSVVSIMASSVTNQSIFSAQNFAGVVLTNNQNNRVIGMTLEFYQKEYPNGGLTNATRSSDFFQLSTRITRRSIL